MLFGRVLSIRRVRGWISAEPIRPQASAWGYMLALLRSSIRMACRGRLAGLPTPTAASQLSPNPRHCKGVRAYLFGMKRLQKSAEGSFPGMATRGTKTQKRTLRIVKTRNHATHFVPFVLFVVNAGATSPSPMPPPWHSRLGILQKAQRRDRRLNLNPPNLSQHHHSPRLTTDHK